MEVLGVILFILCLIFCIVTIDDTSAEDSYEIHKYWQGD